MISEYMEEQLRTEYGITLDSSLQNTVESLNEIPESIIADAKKIDVNEAYLIECFLGFYVDMKNERFLRAFVQDVIVNNEKVDTWRRGRMLIRDVTLEELMTQSKEELYGESLQNIKYCKSPNYDAWEQGSNIVGAFLIEWPDSDYTSIPPKGYMIIKDPEVMDIPGNNLSIWHRRVITSRIARFLLSEDALANAMVAKTLLEDLAPSNLWSTDTEVAIHALIEEMKYINDDQVPGFIGPSQLYQ